MPHTESKTRVRETWDFEANEIIRNKWVALNHRAALLRSLQLNKKHYHFC